MQIKNKYYPYPVIAAGNDSYEGSQFLTDANYEQNAHNIKFLFEAVLDDEMLLKMISEGKVKYAHHVECQQTCYRELILTDEPHYTHIVHENTVNGLVQVCSFLMADQDIIAYSQLGIGRLIYQLPMSLCDMFIKEVFGDAIPDILEDEEAMSTIAKFFENNLNISETARQLYVHRNTLVYRLERIEKAIGLDIRKFDDAMTFRIAVMVIAHVKDTKKQ